MVWHGTIPTYCSPGGNHENHSFRHNCESTSLSHWVHEPHYVKNVEFTATKIIRSPPINMHVVWLSEGHSVLGSCCSSSSPELWYHPWANVPHYLHLGCRELCRPPLLFSQFKRSISMTSLGRCASADSTVDSEGFLYCPFLQLHTVIRTADSFAFFNSCMSGHLTPNERHRIKL